jgi:molecular chaperone DnaK (HSP70)
MKLGIDFGTTRIVVAAADRGNYPVVPFETAEGVYEWFPPLVALRQTGDEIERRFGWDAWHAQAEPRWTIIRSIKRYLENAGPETLLEADGITIPITELLDGVVAALAQALRARFPDKPLEAMLGVPANANSNQRFLTVEAFRRGGFEVLGLLNEPSAASIEYGHKHEGSSGRILVYDLGGGTFDVSLVEKDQQTHTVLASEGISTLGGDDFDRVLAEMAVGSEEIYTLTPAELFRLEEECRQQKEALNPNSRRLVIDLDSVREGLGQVTIATADFYEHCRPMVEETVAATADLATDENIEALYITGGASELPLISRVLREEFGRKVKRSEYTRSATAIGLAIQADATSGYKLREMFTRDFGVWREAESGQRIVFDPIFPRGTRLPGPDEPPLEVRRRYQPVHNVGHFRYLEATHAHENGHPLGDFTVWDEILFPFDPSLSDDKELDAIAVALSEPAAIQHVEELYQCDAAGAVAVTIRNLTSHYKREYRLGRWSEKPAVLKRTAAKPKAAPRKRKPTK